MVNFPNYLTSLRFVLALIIMANVIKHQYAVAFMLFAIASATDVLDGWSARHFNLVTKLGAVLDPIADKFLTNTIFLTLAWENIVPIWFVAIVFIRDIGILTVVGFFFRFTKVRAFPPSKWGKWSTFAQIIVAGAYMLDLVSNFPFVQKTAVLGALLLVSAGLTIMSGVDYARQGFRMYHRAIL